MAFTTEAYQRQALRLLLDEANQVAKELHLVENLPIMETNLVEFYITPPRIAEGMKALGNISTRQYRYFVSVENKFSFLEQGFDEGSMNRNYGALKANYLWPMSRQNTNAAYELAVQFLAAVSMDVAALNRECRLQILAWTPEGVAGEHFVPIYWVRWYRGRQVVAMVELFEPTKSLRQLRVEEGKYILRKPLKIQNADQLLLQTNATAKPE